jgi:DNA polymerase III subunit gamma/tau
MSYLVLARKWRPKSFAQMVGQDHILTIMKNSLEQQKLHHAYLFCGTRGVGKTTLARIFAKCLNCEQGMTSTPCGECNTCKQIDAGNFPDLIEIDAASRTKVEDTRDLLDNVQYAPTAGKYKVYLIDEVHMLSGHSFNALLKTLEEPPEHVKFLLATTDPQKLPVTVLSRCLKLQLKMLSVTQIETHLAYVLTQEKIAFEQKALQQIAQAAQGSVRDSLSLLDQAIAFSGSKIEYGPICTMLGTSNHRFALQLLQALADNNTANIFDCINEMETTGSDYIQTTQNLSEKLYQIALYQQSPEVLKEAQDIEAIATLAQHFTAEDTQLLYQISLSGGKDIPLAPTPKIGFEMLVLRMKCFYPLANNTTTPPLLSNTPAIKQTESKSPKEQKKTNTTGEITKENWHQVVKSLNISGMTQMLAKQCSVANLTNSTLELRLSETHQSLGKESQQTLLKEAIAAYVGKPLAVTFSKGKHDQTPPLDRQKQDNVNLKSQAVETLNKDAHIQQLMAVFDASIDEDTVQPINE